MSRLPQLPPDQLSAEQRETYEMFENIGKTAFKDHFIWQRKSDSALVGPYPAFLEHPDVGAEAMKFFGLVGKIPGLPPDARETAILAVGAQYKAAYELYAHQAIAVKTTNLTLEQSREMAEGKKPEGLNQKCEIAFDIATYLASKPGPLPQNLWDKSVEAFGKDGTMALIHYTGFYAYVSILLNAIDATVPAENE